MEKLPFLQSIAPAITPLLYTCTSNPVVHTPLTVIGDVLYEDPLPGVEIVGALEGGGCFLVASKPYVLDFGPGTGICSIARAVPTETASSITVRHPTILIKRLLRRILSA